MVTPAELRAILQAAIDHGLDVTKLSVGGAYPWHMEFVPRVAASPPAKEDPAPPRTALDMLDVHLNESADRVEYPKMGAEVEAPRPAGTVGWATDNPAKEK